VKSSWSRHRIESVLLLARIAELQLAIHPLTKDKWWRPLFLNSKPEFDTPQRRELNRPKANHWSMYQQSIIARMRHLKDESLRTQNLIPDW
jgi:hypothetical protein